MKNLIRSILIVLGIGLCQLTTAQRTYTNLEWTDQTPVVGDTYFHTSSMVYNDYLYVTSNVVNENGDTDVLLIKYDSEGDTVWMKSYNGSADGDDYGIELTTYSGSYIYVTGAVENTSSGYDYVVLKYDATDGDLEWSYNYDGPEGGTDIPSYILVNSSGSVFVCGGVEDGYGYSDFGVIGVESNGTLSWEVQYDDNNLYDAAASMEFIQGGNIAVTGGSNYSAGVWNVIVRRLDYTDGSTINTHSSSSSVAFLDVTAMTTDTDNNVYVTGYTEDSDKDVHTVKFDSTLTVDWVVDYDGGNDDEGNDIAVDDQGNVYVVGYTELDSGGYNYLTIKYNSSGTQQWAREIGNAGLEQYAVAEKLVLDNDENVYLTGTTEQGSETWMSFAKYDTDGELKLVKDYNTESVEESAYDIDFYDDAVFITGLSYTTPSRTLTVLKYEVDERPYSVLQESSVDAYVDDEIIIGFHPDSVDVNIVNDLDKTFGTLEEFVTEGVIDELDHAYPSVDWDKVRTYKVFKRLTANDTTSISRTGFEVDIPKFWATFVLSLPNEDQMLILDSLDSVDVFPAIQYSQPNHVFSITSDPLYSTYQLSLYPSTSYPDADINVEPAWTLETGKDHVKIGVYDEGGVMWGHEDLGGVFGTPNSKVKGGWDYGLDASLEFTPNSGDNSSHGHGTRVAGIIGAIKDNDHGISGIAGGYWPYDPWELIQGDPTPGENIGVSLYGFNVLGVGLQEDELTAALLEGASNSTGDYGYGLHAMNCSWLRNIPYTSETQEHANLFIKVQREIFKNGCVLVVSRGNNGDTDVAFPAYGRKEFWLLSVGGSGNDGNYESGMSYGNGIDLVAPADATLIYSTDNGSSDDYGSIGQTSAAAPHVTGVAGLMMSHINDQTATPNNLFPDDVEFLLQKYAYDVATSPASSGYDAYTGHGLLDAGNVMSYIDKTEYIVKHYFVDYTFTGTTGGACSGSGNCEYMAYEDETHPYAVYAGESYTFGTTASHTLNSGDVILNYWPLNSYCNTIIYNYSMDGIASMENEMTVSNVTTTSAVLSGQTFHFTHDAQGNALAQDFWWPLAPGETAKFGYTLHIETDYAGTEEQEKELTFTCFPNPSESSINISFLLQETKNVSIEIIDVNGKVVSSIEPKDYPIGQQNVNLNVNSLSSGLYSIRLRLDSDYYYEKFVKK